jgi:co-chaperonin GroES (HSP10)
MSESEKKIPETKMEPVDTRCIVRIKKAPEKQGDIILPESAIKHENESLMVGVLVKRGPYAFQDIADEKHKPQIGDVVQIVRYAGVKKESGDYIFRVVQDNDIYAKGYDGDETEVR